MNQQAHTLAEEHVGRKDPAAKIGALHSRNRSNCLCASVSREASVPTEKRQLNQVAPRQSSATRDDFLQESRKGQRRGLRHVDWKESLWQPRMTERGLCMDGRTHDNNLCDLKEEGSTAASEDCTCSSSSSSSLLRSRSRSLRKIRSGSRLNPKSGEAKEPSIQRERCGAEGFADGAPPTKETCSGVGPCP